MTRKIRPAADPTTNRVAITTKANLGGWVITTGPADEDGVIELTMTRDQWVLIVGCKGQTAFGAALQRPGDSCASAMLSLRQLTRYLRGNRAQMGAFYIGQRVVVGDKCGEVDDIQPDPDGVKVRLVVHLDGGAVAEPFTTHVRAENEEAA
ncbi:hypothetical protein [Microbispora bryophytorum]|uniref:hypothetical protein n=1 Tax=Microbispora bryophytorum TaxID=1460882 RepID=UPI0033DB8F78